MKIQVTFEMDDDDPMADPDHPMGVTARGLEYIMSAVPGYDVDVKRVDDE